MTESDSYIKIMPADDMVYIRLRAGEISKTLERGDNIMVDVDSEGKVLAIEIIGVSSTPLEALLAVLAEFRVNITRQEKHILAAAAA